MQGFVSTDVGVTLNGLSSDMRGCAEGRVGKEDDEME